MEANMEEDGAASPEGPNVAANIAVLSSSSSETEDPPCARQSPRARQRRTLSMSAGPPTKKTLPTPQPKGNLPSSPVLSNTLRSPESSKCKHMQPVVRLDVNDAMKYLKMSPTINSSRRQKEDKKLRASLQPQVLPKKNVSSHSTEAELDSPHLTSTSAEPSTSKSSIGSAYTSAHDRRERSKSVSAPTAGSSSSADGLANQTEYRKTVTNEALERQRQKRRKLYSSKKGPTYKPCLKKQKWFIEENARSFSSDNDENSASDENSAGDEKSASSEQSFRGKELSRDDEAPRATKKLSRKRRLNDEAAKEEQEIFKSLAPVVAARVERLQLRSTIARITAAADEERRQVENKLTHNGVMGVVPLFSDEDTEKSSRGSRPQKVMRFMTGGTSRGLARLSKLCVFEGCFSAAADISRHYSNYHCVAQADLNLLLSTVRKLDANLGYGDGPMPFLRCFYGLWFDATNHIFVERALEEMEVTPSKRTKFLSYFRRPFCSEGRHALQGCQEPAAGEDCELEFDAIKTALDTNDLKDGLVTWINNEAAKPSSKFHHYYPKIMKLLKLFKKFISDNGIGKDETNYLRKGKYVTAIVLVYLVSARAPSSADASFLCVKVWEICKTYIQHQKKVPLEQVTILKHIQAMLDFSTFLWKMKDASGKHEVSWLVIENFRTSVRSIMKTECLGNLSKETKEPAAAEESFLSKFLTSSYVQNVFEEANTYVDLQEGTEDLEQDKDYRPPNLKTALLLRDVLITSIISRFGRSAHELSSIPLEGFVKATVFGKDHTILTLPKNRINKTAPCHFRLSAQEHYALTSFVRYYRPFITLDTTLLSPLFPSNASSGDLLKSDKMTTRRIGEAVTQTYVKAGIITSFRTTPQKIRNSYLSKAKECMFTTSELKLLRFAFGDTLDIRRGTLTVDALKKKSNSASALFRRLLPCDNSSTTGACTNAVCGLCLSDTRGQPERRIKRHKEALVALKLPALLFPLGDDAIDSDQEMQLQLEDDCNDSE